MRMFFAIKKHNSGDTPKYASGLVHFTHVLLKRLQNADLGRIFAIPNLLFEWKIEIEYTECRIREPVKITGVGLHL